MKYWWIFGGLIIIIDQISKFIILKNYPQWVSLNKGIAFGLFASNIWTILSLLCLLILSILPKKDLCLILIISGGWANFLDRIRIGRVIDFINPNSIFSIFAFPLPYFNFADVVIVLGVIWYFLKPLLSATSNKQ